MPQSSGRYQNLEDLNSGRDEINWYWRLIALVSSWMILGGYLILPNAFMRDPELRFSKGVLSILIVTIMTTGYSFTALLCFACRNWLFQAESVFLPALIASALGLLTVLWSFASSTRFIWNTAAIITVALAGFSSLLYGVLLISTHRKIQRFRKQISSMPNYADSHDKNYITNYIKNVYPSAVNSGTNIPPTEQEQINQHLARLLMKNDPGPSPEAWQSTFNISLPEDPSHEAGGREILHGRRTNTHHGLYEPERQIQSPGRSTWNRMAGAIAGHRGRSDTLTVQGRGRDATRSDGDTPRALSREERRREIELGQL
ncbi:hypothetical protein EJ05DRAFT_501524 [Pseudovirgaria hyperparasitica]|uniref:Uncharacterized protein n=1 Tax=Pseudovirgaria hyperparasitica TaxID=470096 RepID=A0A6A6W483_9PEZI|nr:uncharacterized protein EJ05DRAFT_501524 [Pseudovirgaria hyperparasitica]KAF2756979.1 hypothetical protein EJ05DRAFT_501524 [Pseudovirgaria hyperparasitica]